MQTMSTTSKSTMPCSRYHDNAFQFVFQSLHHAQKILDRIPPQGDEEEVSHISGQELLQGVRSLAISQFGLMARMVFRHWGVRSTTDFGRIVFELIERGEMRKTDSDQISDFMGVFDFDEAFDRDYQIDTRHAFTS